MCEIVKALTSASGIRIKAIIALVGELQILLAGCSCTINSVVLLKIFVRREIEK